MDVGRRGGAHELGVVVVGAVDSFQAVVDHGVGQLNRHFSNQHERLRMDQVQHMTLPGSGTGVSQYAAKVSKL